MGMIVNNLKKIQIFCLGDFMKRGLVLLVFCLLIVGCSTDGYRSIGEAMQQGGIQYKQIYHKHEVENAVVVFYDDPNGGINVGLVNKKSGRYKWGFGGGTVSSQMTIQFGWVDLDVNSKEKRFQIYYGILKEPSVTRLRIEHRGNDKYIDKDAEIVELSDGTRLWFALQDQYSSIHPGFILNGYNQTGENVFHFE